MRVAASQRLGYEDLLHYFHEGGKPAHELKIGGEFELFGVRPDSGIATPYGGEKGVRKIMERLLALPQWSPFCEGGNLICLLGKNRSQISLEPGAQIELSGAPWKTLGEVADELACFLDQLRMVSLDLEVDFMGIGMHPISRAEEIPFVDKCRYEIMAPYLKEKGVLSHTMMKETATVQVNLDYIDEQDAMEKLRTAMGITSVVSAMYANSPLSEGRPNGFLTRREHVWLHTDPDRCGLLPFVFEEEVSFEDYLKYSLKVPMMFIIRDGRWIPMKGISFGDYLKEGSEGYQATREDWELHQSTLFPEIRLKQYLEIRGVDEQAPAMVLTVPAFWKGILYDREARRAAWGLVRDWRYDERMALHEEVCRKGLRATIRGRSILGTAQELVRIAGEGLRRQGEEEALLDPLEALILTEEKCPAELLLDKWEKWGHDVKRLISYCSYFQMVSLPK